MRFVGFFVLEITTTPKFCYFQIWHFRLCISTSGHHKFSNFIRPNFLIKMHWFRFILIFLDSHWFRLVWIFSCSNTNLGLLRRQSHSVYHSNITSSTKRLPKASYLGEVLKPCWAHQLDLNRLTKIHFGQLTKR